MALPEEQLPITLPEVESYQPSGTGESPLATIQEWVNTTDPETGQPARRETNTMPQWAGSCWYYLRYLDPKNDQAAWDPAKEKLLDAGGPLRGRGRARRASPALRTLLAQGALRCRTGFHARAFMRLVNQGMILGFSYRYYTAGPGLLLQGGAHRGRERLRGRRLAPSRTPSVPLAGRCLAR